MPEGRVLITGSTGMLGKNIVESFLEKSTFEIYGISRKRIQDTQRYQHIAVDLSDFSLLKQIMADVNPQIIVHCAGNVNVDDCENNKEYAYNLHVNSTDILASYNPPRTKFIYISTDSVYDGSRFNHSEVEETSPSNYYAKTKLEGEKCAQRRNQNTLILRTNIYGFKSHAGTSLAEWALGNLAQNLTIDGFEDVFFNPVYTKQFARLIHSVIDAGFKGTVNIGSNSFVSKYDFLIRLCEQSGFSKDLVRKRCIDHKRFAAQRPMNTTMDVSRLKSIIGQVPDFQSGIEEMKIDWDTA